MRKLIYLYQLGSQNLGHGPLCLLRNTTLGQAALDAIDDVGGQRILEALNILTIEHAYAVERRLHDVFTKVKEGLSDLFNAGVWVVLSMYSSVASSVSENISPLDWAEVAVITYPCGKTARVKVSAKSSRAVTPFSSKKDVTSRPLTGMLSSVARLCTCGELRPQGPRKATVIAAPLPIRPGNVSALAETILPPMMSLG